MKYKRFGALLIAILLSYHLFLAAAWAAATTDDLAKYQNFQERLNDITTQADIASSGFKIIEGHVFLFVLDGLDEVFFVPALDRQSNRLAVFVINADGTILYKTDRLAANNQIRGAFKQPNKGIAAVSFQDLNGDSLTDIVLITLSEDGTKVGDVLFQNETSASLPFYRDHRITDNINHYGMNKSIQFIVTHVRDGFSTEFLYTATTMEQLTRNGFEVSERQSYWKTFEKLGKLKVVPGTYRMAEYSVFMIYLINDQGYIIWSFQPMGNYESLFWLKGIACEDINGDGLLDIAVLAYYSYEDINGESIQRDDYSIYYQRTNGFDQDYEFKKQYQIGEDETLGQLVEKARAYWGWQ